MRPFRISLLQWVALRGVDALDRVDDALRWLARRIENTRFTVRRWANAIDDWAFPEDERLPPFNDRWGTH